MPHCRANRFRQCGRVGQTVPQPSQEASTLGLLAFLFITKFDNPLGFLMELLIIILIHKLVFVDTAQAIAYQPQAENNGDDT